MLIEGSTMGSGKVFELLVDSAFKQVRCGLHVAGHAFWRIQVGKQRSVVDKLIEPVEASPSATVREPEFLTRRDPPRYIRGFYLAAVCFLF